MNTSQQPADSKQRSALKRNLGSVITIVLALLAVSPLPARGQTRQLSSRAAIVVDERLSVLRSAPDLSAPLLRRIGRGRVLSVVGSHRASRGVQYYRVAVTRRTRGWIQREALILPRRPGDDQRLLLLIKASADFDRIARARIFLDAFPRSPLRPAVLLLFGDDAAKAARKLSQDVVRRLDLAEMKATGAPVSSYFLNYNGLDRYRKQDIVFTFDGPTRQFHYDGASWRELIRRHPKSAEAIEARQRLGKAVGRRQ